MLEDFDLFDLDQPALDAAALSRESLNGAQEIMGVAFDALPISLMFHTAYGVLYANTETSALLGVKPSALIGQHLLDYVAECDTGPVIDGLRIALEDAGKKTIVEALLVGAGGRDRLCRLIFVRLPWPGNPIVQVLISDITDQRRAEVSLRQLTITDELTGAYNRRHAFYEGALYVDAFKADGCAFSVAMVDIDHFKRVNDTYGHAIGDEVLRVLTGCAHTLLTSIRVANSAMFARIGGEEFVLLLPGAGLGNAAKEAERLRERVEALVVQTDLGPLRVTISLGVASMTNVDESFEDLLCRADAALYRAKKGGRNQVVIDS